jgi:hypothetical protein
MLTDIESEVNEETDKVTNKKPEGNDPAQTSMTKGGSTEK